MDGRAYTFLLSIAAVPACEAAVDEDSGPPTPLQTACEAFGTAYVECFGGDDGYLEKECRDLAAYFEPHGPACTDAMEDWFACLAPLDCPMLADVLPDACTPVYASAHDTCPELFPLCPVTAGYTGSGACQSTASECLDGREYTVQCDLVGDTYQCTCTANGTLTARFSDADPCEVERLGELAAKHCEFPEGVDL